MTISKVKLVDLDPEVLAMLKGGSSKDIAKFMTMYFDKRTDKVTESLIDAAYTDKIKKYSDDEDKKIKNSLSNYRIVNTPINENDLGAGLVNKINNCISTVNGLTKNSAIIAPDGSTVNLSILYQKILSMQREIDGLKNSQNASANILSDAKKYTDQKCATLQSSITQTNNDIVTMDKKFAYYRLKNTPISENDLDTALKNKLNMTNNSFNNLYKMLFDVKEKIVAKSVDLNIPANSSYTINLSKDDTPEQLNVKVYIFDTEKNSRTYNKYINAEGVITVSISYEDDGKIILYNDSDQQNTVKLIYYSSNSIKSNVDYTDDKDK